jgi:hypothetical protein
MADDQVFELRTYHVLPGRLESFAALAVTVGAQAGRKHGELLGQWTTQTVEIGRVVEMWRYADFHHRTAGRDDMARSGPWRAFVRRAPAMLSGTESLILLQSDAWSFSPPAKSPVYELRDYRLHPGKTAQWLECWAKGMTVRQNFSKPVGIWYSELGELNRIVHLWPYDHLQHRHDVRRAAIKDPLWRDTVATLATLMQRMESTILVPTAASKLK